MQLHGPKHPALGGRVQLQLTGPWRRQDPRRWAQLRLLAAGAAFGSFFTVRVLALDLEFGVWSSALRFVLQIPCLVSIIPLFAQPIKSAVSPSAWTDPQRLAALHCLLVYMGNDPKLELKVTVPVRDCRSFGQLKLNRITTSGRVLNFFFIFFFSVLIFSIWMIVPCGLLFNEGFWRKKMLDIEPLHNKSQAVTPGIRRSLRK